MFAMIWRFIYIYIHVYHDLVNILLNGSARHSLNSNNFPPATLLPWRIRTWKVWNLSLGAGWSYAGVSVEDRISIYKIVHEHEKTKHNLGSYILRNLGGCELFSKNPWDVSQGVKTTCFEASGVFLGGSGVSIGGVRILAVGLFVFWLLWSA